MIKKKTLSVTKHFKEHPLIVYVSLAETISSCDEASHLLMYMGYLI